jgi:hypothetical protein
MRVYVQYELQRRFSPIRNGSKTASGKPGVGLMRSLRFALSLLGFGALSLFNPCTTETFPRNALGTNHAA